MKYSTVLIVTYGRSGSTLLQGILNSIDGYLIRGENYNMCYSLFRAYESLMKTKQTFGKGDKTLYPNSAWFGAAKLNKSKFLQNARQLVINQILPEETKKDNIKCIGFKEIRYLPQNLCFPNEDYKERLHSYLDFLNKLFHNPIFVCLTRNHEEVKDSGWWREGDPKEIFRQLTLFEQVIQEYGHNNKRFYFINYYDLVNNSSNLKGLFNFLNAPYNKTKIEEVLNIRHSDGANLERNSFSNYTVTLASNDENIEKIAIDSILPIRASEGGKINLSGVVVIRSEKTDNYRLKAKDISGEHHVKWKIASPVIAKTLPSNPYSTHSRFNIDSLVFSQSVPIELMLVNDHGEDVTIARVVARTESVIQ